MADNLPNIERHIQTVVSAVAIALLSWTAYSLNSLQQTSVRQEERTIAIQTTLANQGDQVNSNQKDIIDLRIRVDRLEQKN